MKLFIFSRFLQPLFYEKNRDEADIFDNNFKYFKGAIFNFCFS